MDYCSPFSIQMGTKMCICFGLAWNENWSEIKKKILVPMAWNETRTSTIRITGPSGGMSGGIGST
jgi:hypothetical protein